MIRTLRLFLSGVIVGFMGAWWFRPQWDDAQALIAAITDAGETYRTAIDALTGAGMPGGTNADEESRGA